MVTDSVSISESTDPSSSPRTKLLDAAEAEFSRVGFGGATTKAIAAAAGVAQGLLHYHFGAKERLFEAVIERRSGLINASRLALLAEVDADTPDATSRIFEAFFRPPLGPEGGGPTFAPIFASLSVGGERERALVARHYDAPARRFVDALTRTGVDRTVAASAYGFALGALIGSVGREGRVRRLGGPDDGPDETEALIERLVAFATGGLRALAEPDPLPTSRPRAATRGRTRRSPRRSS